MVIGMKWVNKGTVWVKLGVNGVKLEDRMGVCKVVKNLGRAPAHSTKFSGVGNEMK